MGAAYMHGNLAVEQETGKKVKIRETRKIIYRKKTLPTQEKLLYLFTIILCCIVAGVIIWRYAQIYEINTTVQQIKKDISVLELENSEMKLEISKLQNPERLIQKGLELGLILPNGDETGIGQQKIPLKQQEEVSVASSSSNR